MMRRKLKDYFAWKSNFQKSKPRLFEKKPDDPANEDAVEDPRLKMKRRGGVPPNKRRRIRGAGPASIRNAASGVIEIPDDDPDDITQM